MMTSFPSDISTKLYLTDPDMVWSYSRIKSYHSCKYGFYLKYIKGKSEEPKFFSQYGSFMHKILEKYFKSELTFEQLSSYYIVNFNKAVTAPPPSLMVFSNYFTDGLEYLRDKNNLKFSSINGVERRVNFKVGNYKMTGFVDLILNNDDGTVSIVDRKSKILKPYSGRKKPTLYDAELDDYFRQLYIYSIPINEKSTVSNLMLNSFRKSILINTEFDSSKFESAKSWVTNSISEIINTEWWEPNGLSSEYYCRWICGLSSECEYFQTNCERKTR